MKDKNALIGYFTEYRGFKGTIEYDYEDHIYHGKIIDTKDFVNYQAKKLDKLREEFKNAVDDYLLFLDEITELNNKR